MPAKSLSFCQISDGNTLYKLTDRGRAKGGKDLVDNITGGGTGGESGERATGTPNTIYDLSSVLFHALEGGASYDTYIEDAEREGDQELADFFRLVRDEDSARAHEAQTLLAERTPTAEGTGRMTTSGGAGTEPSGVPPMTEEGPLGSGERASLGREDPLPREGRASLGREDPRPGGESARENQGEEDKGLLDKAKEALTGEDSERREEPPRRP
jgi:hypothetical protein